MAATAAFPTLPVPQEDSMDMSSPHGAYNDGDIDLDFDTRDFDGGVELPEDERMLTDGEQTRPGTATDDMMEDDVQVEESYVEEAVMDDDTTVVPQTAQDDDEELIDYDDEDLATEQQPQPTGDQALPDVETVDYGQQSQPEHVEQPQELVEQVDEEIVRQPEDATAEELHAVPTAEPVAEAAFEPLTAHVEAERAETGQTEGLPTEEAAATQAVNDEPAATTADATQAEASEEQAFEYGDGTEEYTYEADAAEPALALDTSARAASIEAPGTPTDTGLHPMTLYYDGTSMPLFKSKRQLDGLLKDDNLANLSLHELMHNIRERLVQRIGDVPEEQELTLAFDHMNLLLVGNSRAAFEYSLSDVLAVYLDLHQNDGTPAEEIPSLALILTQNHFSSQLSWLKQAAAGGIAMSTVTQSQQTYLQQDLEHDEHDEHDGQDGQDGDATYEEHEQQQEYYEDGGEGPEHTEHHHDEEQYEQGQEGQHNLPAEDALDEEDSKVEEPQEQLNEQYEVDEQGQESYTTAEADATADATSAGSGEQVEATEHVALPQVTEGDADAVSAVPAGEEADQAESDASSATLNGEAVDESTGEYNWEEQIDWDDDSDLTSPFSEPAKDGRDDFLPAQKTEHTEDPATLAQEADSAAQTARHETSTGIAGPNETSEAVAEVEASQHGETVDEVAESEQPQPDGTNTEESGQYEQAYGYEDQTYQDQADTYEEQQGTLDGPGEDEVQYHADLDYLNGESYEHGLEHHPTDEETQAADPEADADGEDYAGDDVLDFDDHDEQPASLEDDLGFNDDTPADAAAREAASRKASQSDLKTPLSGSPSVKRSFDETAEVDFDFEEPELKKVKSG